MTTSNVNVKNEVEQWLTQCTIPVTSAAYHLSDKAAIAISTGYVDSEIRRILYTRLQKAETTPRVGNPEELGKLAALASSYYDVTQENPAAALDTSRFLPTEVTLRANDVKSAFAHRRYRKHMGALGSRRRLFLANPAFARSWMGIRDEKSKGIFLSAQQRHTVFDALCRVSAPDNIDYQSLASLADDRYRLRTSSLDQLPPWAQQAQHDAQAPHALEQAPESSHEEPEEEKTRRSLLGNGSSFDRAMNASFSAVSRIIAGRAVNNQSWTSSREQLRQVHTAELHFVDAYDTALYVVGIIVDRLDRSPAWNGEALEKQAASIDITAEAMEIAADIIELRDVIAALERRQSAHGVTTHRRLRDLAVVWQELVERVVALVALADAVDIVDAEIVRWSEHRNIDSLDERIDHLVARSGYRATSNAYDHSVREDIEQSGRVMATARSIIEQEIGALGR